MEEIFGFCLTPPARLTRRAVLGAACLLAASLGQAQPAAAPESPKAPVRFVALGDMPYGDPAPYLELIGQINRLRPDFSVHVGDVQSGLASCSNASLRIQREHFDLYEGAVVYTPGDNEWTDCHRLVMGGHDPIERLAFVRQTFYTPGRSLGQAPIRVENQSAQGGEWTPFVENQRWEHGGLLFATLHIVGSNNNLNPPDPRGEGEFAPRDRANRAWIREAFALAQQRGAKALVFAMQADVFERRRGGEDFPGNSGFRQSIGQTLVPLAAASPIPVLLVHGDTHQVRFDQPFIHQGQPVKQLTRLEVPGGGDVRAVEVTVDPAQAPPFQVRLINPR